MTESPFVVSTRELGRQPGSSHTVELSVTSTNDMGNEVIGVPAGRPIDLDLRLEAVMEGVLVTGVARAEASGECVRCLRPVAADVAVDATELFVYPGERHPEADDLGADETLPEVRADAIDMESTVIDAVVTSLPLRPLCDPGCPGLCPECGIHLDEAEPDHGHDRTDPRWDALAALAGVLQQDEQSDSAAEASERRDSAGDGVSGDEVGRR
ncbi:MAG TPA: DUF177 domain-containing protein [Beutenbergiaceae bacterium]|nr:DUF177 domain-containing protein [Beutenbergiaceae bacterium]